jgi:hypothetical protein
VPHHRRSSQRARRLTLFRLARDPSVLSTRGFFVPSEDDRESKPEIDDHEWTEVSPS